MKEQIIITIILLICVTSYAQRYDAIVSAGKSIQAAIEAAPVTPAKPYVILIKNGVYNEKVIIDKPNIIMVGESRDSTRLVFAELASKRTVKEYKGKPVGNGVIVLQQGADDCIISGLTVYNDYGTTVEQTTAHQMAIYGQATRTIVINCKYGPTAMMHYPCGRRRAMECIIMPTLICVVWGLIFYVRVVGVMLPVVRFMAMDMP